MLSSFAKTQNFAIEASKMNIFYAGVYNPFKVVIENTPCKLVRVKSSIGVIEGDSCNYTFYTPIDNSYRTTIYIGLQKRDSILWFNQSEYRVEKIPLPTPYIAGKKGGEIEKSRLISGGDIIPILENFDCDCSFIIKSYALFFGRNDSIIYIKNKISGNRLTPEIIEQIQKTITNDKIKFYDIIAIAQDKREMNLSEMTFTIK